MADPPKNSNIYECLNTALGEVTVRKIESVDVPIHADYLFSSPKEFLEDIGFDTARFPSRSEWESDARQRILATNGTGEPPSIVAAEHQGCVISTVSLDRRNPDGVARLHFHIFDPNLRGHGLGAKIFMAGVRIFGRLYGIERFVIEPKADNRRMNALMQKLGFRHLQNYNLAAGPATQQMIVSQYEIILPSTAMNALASKPE